MTQGDLLKALQYFLYSLNDFSVKEDVLQKTPVFWGMSFPDFLSCGGRCDM